MGENDEAKSPQNTQQTIIDRAVNYLRQTPTKPLHNQQPNDQRELAGQRIHHGEWVRGAERIGA